MAKQHKTTGTLTEDSAESSRTEQPEQEAQGEPQGRVEAAEQVTPSPLISRPMRDDLVRRMLRSQSLLIPLAAVFYGGMGTIFSKPLRSWIIGNWPYLLGVFGLWFVAALIAQAKEQTRRLLVAFGVVPVVVGAVIGIIFLQLESQVLAVKVVVIIIASAIPAAFYFLFVATRRPTILNEFVGNLAQLGLLGRHSLQGTRLETEAELRARMDSYFQKFESVYGVLRFEGGNREFGRSEYVDWLFDSSQNIAGAEPPTGERPRGLPQPSVRLADFFASHMCIPIALATILAVTGWMMVLQPELPQRRASTNVANGPATVPPSNTVNPSPTEAVPEAKPPAMTENPGLAEAVPEIKPPAKTANPSPAEAFLPRWTPMNFAFLGAYFFGLQLLFRRYTRRDLGPNALIAFSLRILLTMVAVWVTIACYNFFVPPKDSAPNTYPNELLIAAFVIGVFPRVLWQLISAALTKVLHLSIVMPSFESKQPLSELDGLTVWHESRFEEEDIENVPNMATADIVHLMLHTQSPPERLLDWVDQAILLKVLGPQSAEDEGFRRFLGNRGVRTATQFVLAFCTKQDAEAAEKSLSSDGQPAKPDKVDLASIARMIAVEGNFSLVSCWRGLPYAMRTRPAGHG